MAARPLHTGDRSRCTVLARSAPTDGDAPSGLTHGEERLAPPHEIMPAQPENVRRRPQVNETAQPSRSDPTMKKTVGHERSPAARCRNHRHRFRRPACHRNDCGEGRNVRFGTKFRPTSVLEFERAPDRLPIEPGGANSWELPKWRCAGSTYMYRTPSHVLLALGVVYIRPPRLGARRAPGCGFETWATAIPMLVLLHRSACAAHPPPPEHRTWGEADCHSSEDQVRSAAWLSVGCANVCKHWMRNSRTRWQCPLVR